MLTVFSLLVYTRVPGASHGTVASHSVYVENTGLALFEIVYFKLANSTLSFSLDYPSLFTILLFYVYRWREMSIEESTLYLFRRINIHVRILQ